jgi:large subunit ribosomal protein L29
MMKVKEQRTQLRNLSGDEIAKKVQEMQEELFNLRFQAKMGQLANALQLRMVRRNIARAMTLLAQKPKETVPKKAKEAVSKKAKETVPKKAKEAVSKKAKETVPKK